MTDETPKVPAVRVATVDGALVPAPEPARVSPYDVPARASDFRLLLLRLEKLKALYDRGMECPVNFETKQTLINLARELEAMPYDETVAAFKKESGPVSAGALNEALAMITACVPPDTNDPDMFSIVCCDAIAAREPTQFAVRLLANWMTTRPRKGNKKWDIPELLDRLAEAEEYREQLAKDIESEERDYDGRGNYVVVRVRTLPELVQAWIENDDPGEIISSMLYDASVAWDVIPPGVPAKYEGDLRELFEQRNGEGSYRQHLVRHCLGTLFRGDDGNWWHRPDGRHYPQDVLDFAVERRTVIECRLTLDRDDDGAYRLPDGVNFPQDVIDAAIKEQQRCDAEVERFEREAGGANVDNDQENHLTHIGQEGEPKT
jgi:hypothetical protein